MKPEHLREIVAELVTRPGHEKVRAHLHRLLTDGLGAKPTEIDFERQVPEVRGRIDALLGRTLFEIKSDLRRERKDADAQLLRYLPQREKEANQRFVGIATDGADFVVAVMRDDKLAALGTYRTRADDPRELLRWLESVVVLQTELPPDIFGIKRELGRESVHYRRALHEIERLWDRLKGRPEAILKRDLWNRLLRVAYGGDVEAPDLFLQHTYLTIVAKSVATLALLDTVPPTGEALLSGQAFRDLGIVGAIESDFFDWILLEPPGDNLVMEIARHANRFKLRDINADILKGLYESLIDPSQRHDLGEYYTPDWLAARIVEATVKKPLADRVIDPACGSGTFLFHAVRKLLAAAEKKGQSSADAVALACEKVAGIDIHPVAVIFARATYLLALQPSLVKGRPSSFSVPVYIGDALQWNAREFMNQRDLEIVVPAAGESATRLPDDDAEGRIILRFPTTVASEPGLFDATLNEMLRLAQRDQTGAVLQGWLKRQQITASADVSMLTESYEALRRLQGQGRNHIWGYVARNLSRPIWLASEKQKADVVVGNPPWLDYRAMNVKTQTRFREEMKATGLWQAKIHGVAFDLSSYFFARAVYLYMRREGRIAFVMPYAAMSRKSYEAFRTGRFKVHGTTEAQVRFTNAWVFPSDVQPLFPVPSCVMFAERSTVPMKLPDRVRVFTGQLPRRDADRNEAGQSLSESLQPWPTDEVSLQRSTYAANFRAGAKLDPRRLILVEKAPASRLGGNPKAPIVRGRTGALDKAPWKNVEPPQGAVESEFIRSVYLGESIGPYRTYDPVLAVIPWNDRDRSVFTAEAAARYGLSRLSSWLAACETIWKKYSKGKTTFREKLDFYHLLSIQFPIRGPRVVYTKSGTNPAAAIVRDNRAVIDHMLYWAPVSDEREAHYLIAIFNSETARARAEKWQATGQWGARHFDKVIFNLPIPKFDPKAALHLELAKAAQEAEKIANSVPLKSGEHFTRARKRIREALTEAGVAERIDALTARLLDKIG
jgi:SAM-dependent methyltransferase